MADLIFLAGVLLLLAPLVLVAWWLYALIAGAVLITGAVAIDYGLAMRRARGDRR